MQKLIVVIMGQNCEKFLPMALKSVKGADQIIFCDGDPDANACSEMAIKQGVEVITKEYDQDDKCANGKQRNFYLNWLKCQHPNDWALCIDADEVVEDIEKFKLFIQTAEPALYSLNMRHFIGDLGHEDANQSPVLNRLFKISEAKSYPEVEHPVLEGTKYGLSSLTIWHLAYIPNLFDYRKKYENHLKKSNMHTPEYLENWYKQHLFGQYPRKPINLKEIPKVILDEFGIDKDEFYFMDRQINTTHSIMVKQWNDYFNPESVLDLGCGRGPYLYFWKWYVGNSYGIELSKWAVNHAFCVDVMPGDITLKGSYQPMELITAIDVLEHLNEEDIDKTLTFMAKYGQRFLFSIPFIGDPNLENDKTHITKQTKEWWINKLSKYFTIKEAPKEWLFNNQMLIGERK